jgi:hypothetical protein
MWLEDAIKQKGCKNEKEYLDKTLSDGKTNNDS